VAEGAQLTTLFEGAISEAACTCSAGFVNLDPENPSNCEECGLGSFALVEPIVRNVGNLKQRQVWLRQAKISACVQLDSSTSLAFAKLALLAASNQKLRIHNVHHVLLETFQTRGRVSAMFVRQEAIQQEERQLASFARQGATWRRLQQRPLMRACRVQLANGAM
jgi:hypothetical protein